MRNTQQDDCRSTDGARRAIYNEDWVAAFTVGGGLVVIGYDLFGHGLYLVRYGPRPGYFHNFNPTDKDWARRGWWKENPQLAWRLVAVNRGWRRQQHEAIRDVVRHYPKHSPIYLQHAEYWQQRGEKL